MHKHRTYQPSGTSNKKLSFFQFFREFEIPLKITDILFLEIIHNLKTKYLLILMYLYHRPKNKEICRCWKLYVFHWTNDCAHLAMSMTHHRTTIDKIMSTLFTSFP